MASICQQGKEGTIHHAIDFLEWTASSFCATDVIQTLGILIKILTGDRQVRSRIENRVTKLESEATNLKKWASNQVWLRASIYAGHLYHANTMHMLP